MNQVSHEAYAAEFLEGVILPNGWRVIEQLAPSSTGGAFGVPYLVEQQNKPGKRAFMKALSLRQATQDPGGDFARAMQKYVTAFNFERDTLSLCADKGMNRIARLLDSGEYKRPGAVLPVCYIIFELATHGDVRKYLANYKAFDLAWILRTMHQVTVAMSQLHTHGIAHQDIKPSNILLFEQFGAKIGDLGCADAKRKPSQSPRGMEIIPGDRTYAPPEFRYREVATNWETRRLGCDLFMLGNIVVFFFTGGLSMPSLLQNNLHPSHFPGNWTGDYRTVLPYVRDGFEKALHEFSLVVPEPVRRSVTTIVRHLCEPDPLLRGHPKERGGNQFALHRFIAEFNLFARRAELNLLQPDKLNGNQ